MMFVVAAGKRMRWIALAAVAPCVLAVEEESMRTMLEALPDQMCSLSEVGIETDNLRLRTM